MYTPQEFRIEDRDVLFSLMARHNFATLVTVQDGAPAASHVPFIVQPDVGENGTLVAHLARANGQWQTLRGEQEALVIFQGPHAYVSPSWYETHPSVPTWNYMTVHVRGKPKLIEAEAGVRRILGDLVSQHEEAGSGWTLEGAEGYVEKMWRRIVAFESAISSIEGKFKLSQNRDETDRRNVAAALSASNDPSVQQLSKAMQGFSL